jgi:catechol 2,3-dioxygenase-like lactoylglutathione lyase family enzyme
MSMKFGHLGIATKEFGQSKTFYKAVCAAMGLPLIAENDDSARFGLDGRTMFYIHTGETSSGPLHVAFEVGSREMVDEFYTAALNAGGKDNGKPGIRENYSPTYYAAFVLDPEGNNIETVCR